MNAATTAIDIYLPSSSLIGDTDTVASKGVKRDRTGCPPHPPKLPPAGRALQYPVVWWKGFGWVGMGKGRGSGGDASTSVIYVGSS